MISVEYSSYFVRKFKKLDAYSQNEILQKIGEFRDLKNHKKLGVHKLTGKMKEQWAFSINFSDRISFYFSANKKTVYLLDIGDHSIYE